MEPCDIMIKTKQITCGVLITDGTHLLICHPTHNVTWNLPKGRQDPGETYAETAVRELAEETGIVLTIDQIELLGEYEYKHNKQIVLFKHTVDQMPAIDNLHCPSLFEYHGVMTPEMDDYAVVDYPTAFDMLNKDLAKVLRTIFV